MTRPGISVAAHPLLDAACFVTRFQAPLGTLDTPDRVRSFFDPAAGAPLATDDEIKRSVRDLLRHGGFKPTGRSKPASEYLIKALEKGWLAVDRGINLAVDTCNAVSLHSGLPISVVDAELARAPWSIGLCPPGASYVFNPAGQIIDVGGLVSLHDAEGPCGGPVKDSQRTKTHGGTTSTLTVIWGTAALPGRTAMALEWYLDLLKRAGAETESVALNETS